MKCPNCGAEDTLKAQFECIPISEDYISCASCKHELSHSEKVALEDGLVKERMSYVMPKKQTSEPRITINGHLLNNAQSSTVRVALESYFMQLEKDPNFLGTDEHGRFMTSAYKTRIEEIREFIFNP